MHPCISSVRNTIMKINLYWSDLRFLEWFWWRFPSSEIPRNEYWYTSTIILEKVAASTLEPPILMYTNQHTAIIQKKTGIFKLLLHSRKLIKEIPSLIFWTKRWCEHNKNLWNLIFSWQWLRSLQRSRTWHCAICCDQIPWIWQKQVPLEQWLYTRLHRIISRTNHNLQHRNK